MSRVSIPSNYQLCFSSSEIEKNILRLSEEILPWASNELEETGVPVLSVCILRGAVFFYSDLMKKISCSIEPAFCRARSYSSETNQKGISGVQVDMYGLNPKDRTVLLVDDICDTGDTFKEVEKVFAGLGAKEVRSVALIDRDVGEEKYQTTWAGMTFKGPDWFVGYGMEDKNKFANLADIYTIQS